MVHSFKHRPAIFILSFLFLLASSAQATVLLNAPAPYRIKEIGVTNLNVYFAASASTTLSSGAFIDIKKGYRIINTSSLGSSANYISLDVSSNKTFTVPAGKQLLVGFSSSISTGSEVPIQFAGVVNSSNDTAIPGTCSSCQGDGARNYSVAYSPGSILRIVFSLADLRLVSGISGSSFDAGLTAMTSDISQTLYLTFGVIDTGTKSPLGATGADLDSSSFTLNLVVTPPLLTGAATDCSVAIEDPNFYFPGDSEIILDTSKYRATSNGSAPLQWFLLLAKKDATPDRIDGTLTPYTNNNVAGWADAGDGSPRIPGFDNTTTGTDNTYRGIVYAVNEAGIVSNGCWSSGAAGIHAQPILGLLKESKCFIATTAYHDGRAFPVMVLRKFRDQILSQFDAGEQLIKFYYRWSPSLAVWAWDKPWVRLLALKYLTPLEIVAFFLTDAKAETPYIDKIRKEMKDPPAESGSYSESLKKKLETEDQGKESKPGETYIEKLKRTMTPEEKKEDSSQGYIEQEKAKLKKEEPRSIIDEVKAGDDKLKRVEKPTIKHAMGIRIGVAPGIGVSVKGGTVSYANMYGSQWKPDFQIHYERQLFHDENFGSVAPTLDFGASYDGALGLLKYPFAGSNRSRTSFAFIQAPFLIGANYRLNVLRILRPYIGANAGAMGYIETRNDKKGDKKGVSGVYSFSGGVALQMDFLDPNAIRDAYDDSGFQHIYLFAEYTHLDTLAGDVLFTRSGIFSGFLFEF